MVTAKEKARQLLEKSTGANYNPRKEKEIAQYWQAKNIIDEVVLALKQSYSPDKEMASNNTGINNLYVNFEDTELAKYWEEVLYYVDNHHTEL